MKLHVSIPPVSTRVANNLSKKTKDDIIKITPSIEYGLPSN